MATPFHGWIKIDHLNITMISPFVVNTLYLKRVVREWSLVMGMGGYKMGKLRVRNLFAPLPPL